MGLLKKVYNLIIINTLERIEEIDTLVKGLVVGTFGILISIIAYLVFNQIGWVFSAEISKLSFIAYLAVSLYHLVAYERSKDRLHGKFGHFLESSIEVLIILILIMFLYTLVFNQLIVIRAISRSIEAQLGTAALILRGTPGLIILAFPLFGWEKFAELTPVDEILKKVFK